MVYWDIMGYFETLDEKQQLAAIALGQGCTATEAAKKAKVDRRTVTRWKHDANFAKAVCHENAHLIADARRELAGLNQLAVNGLREVLENTETPPHVKISAAREVLNRTLGSIHQTTSKEREVVFQPSPFLFH